MKAHWVVVLFFGVAPLSVSAAAPPPLKSIFQADRQGELCMPNDAGVHFVDPQRLAQAIVDDVSVPSFILDRANKGHVGDGNISPEEYNFAVTELRPFGPKAQPNSDKRVEAATKGIRKRMGMLTDWLSSGATTQGYHVIRMGVRSPIATYLFVDNPSVRIQCVKVVNTVASSNPSEPGKVGEILKEIGNKIVIRKKKDQLAKPRGKLKKLDPADMSFRKDKKDGEDIFQVNIIAGYIFDSIETTSSLTKVVPYLKYERTGNSDPEEKDVEVLAAGVLFDWVYFGQDAGFDGGIYPETVMDKEQSSEILKLNVFAGPSFRLPNGNVLFGGYMPPLGPFIIRPDFQVIAEYGHVHDAGKSADLKRGSYSGLGVEVEFKTKIWDVRFLEDFEVIARYRNVNLFSAELDHAERMVVGVTYSIPNSENFALGFEYVDGDNLETLQDEEFWKFTLGFRY